MSSNNFESVHIGRIVKLYKVVWGILNPIRQFNGKEKFTKLFFMFVISQLALILCYLSYMIAEAASLSLAVFTENSALAVQVFRHLSYLMLLNISSAKMNALIDKMITERKLLRPSDDDWQLTIRGARNEFRFTMAGLLGCFCPVCSICIGVFFLKFNSYQLPYNFYLFFLPIDSFLSIRWIVNYLVQVVMIFYTITLFYSYSAFKLLLMNFSCWEIESLGLQVKKLFQSPDIAGQDDQIRITVDRSCRDLYWMKEVREVLRISFFVDFSLSAVIFCMCLYTLSSDPFGSSMVVGLLYGIGSQLALYCWMGNRVNIQIEQLAAAVYDVNWHSVKATYQKDILLILMMAQRIKGFNGIFNSVDLETLQKILQFTYSLLALLKTIN